MKAYRTKYPQDEHRRLRDGAPVNSKYKFIDVEYAADVAAGTAPAPIIMQMCDWPKVSQSGFYDWKHGRNRPPRHADRNSH